MAIEYTENISIFTAIIYEDELVALRDFLQEKAPAPLTFNFTECEDIHLAVLQLILAYKKNYDCRYEFGDETKIYAKVLKGFDTSENYCN
ncbi:hypothetical protein KKG72_08140 [bacterium]|nr:hypothetical protein [bacterium]MBU1994605.1 hypothetical protein [bacterium]